MNPYRDPAADEALLRMLVAAPASGFDISRRAQGGQKSGAGRARYVYLALHLLERRGLVCGEWRRTAGVGVQVRQYQITARGRRILRRRDNDSRHFPVLSPLTVLAVLAVCGRSTTSADARELGPSLTIVVTPGSRISQPDLRRAGMDVLRILGAAGIKADWAFGPSLSMVQRSHPAGLTDGCVIHAEFRVASPSSSAATPGEIALGITRARLHDGVADIVLFDDDIMEFASQTRQDVSGIVALVLAHEIGHVLLPAPAHTDTGLMQVPWDQRALEQAAHRTLLFTARQGALMRMQLAQACEMAARH
jgi:DNA-binding PadR family transcriptional regulator